MSTVHLPTLAWAAVVVFLIFIAHYMMSHRGG